MMGLQTKMWLLVVLMFGILYGVITGIGTWMGAGSASTYSVNYASAMVTDADNGAGESYRDTMIDAHSHIRTPNIDIDIDMDYVFSFLDQANVSKVLLFGPPVPLQNIYRKYPDRVIPFLSPFEIDSSTGKLIISHARLEWVEKQLKSGLFKGIGEINLRHRPIEEAPGGTHNPADSPLMLKLYDLAAQYSVPVNVHVDFEYSDELERALEHNRKTIIIWAHCGHADPPLIRRMMDKHPNLFADLSTSNPYTLGERAPTQEELPTNPDGSIKQEWKDLFEDYSDRLMFGLDMCISRERYEGVRLTVKVTDYYRSFLYQLSPEAAENIAYKTIERILPAPAEVKKPLEEKPAFPISILLVGVIVILLVLGAFLLFKRKARSKK